MASKLLRRSRIDSKESDIIIKPATEPLLKVIEVQEELIKNLQKQIKELEGAKKESKERHTKIREQFKPPTKPNKQKVGFLKKHKPKK